MRRRLKQTIYLLAFLVFWGGIFSGVYLLYFQVPPSCFDTKQNQGEEGIDCGGPCKRFCVPQNLTDIQLDGLPIVFNPVPDRVSVLLKLRNPNVEFGAKQVGYTVRVYGENPSSTLDIVGSTFLYAGEIKYVPLIRPTASIGRATRADISIATSTTTWLPASLMSKPAIRIQDAQTTADNQQGVRVAGRVINDDVLPVTNVSVSALFFGINGGVVGVSQTELPSLDAGESISFLIVHPPITGIAPEATQVFVTALKP